MQVRARHYQPSRRRPTIGSGVGFEPSASEIASAVRAFSAWVQQHHKAGQISVQSNGTIRILSALSATFCIGLQDFRYFIGIPVECFEWWLALPWSQLRVRPGKPWLAVECNAVSTESLRLPAFRLEFEVKPDEYTRHLAAYHFIDVRAAVASNDEDCTFRLSREVYGVLHVAADVESGSSGYRLRAADPPSPANASRPEAQTDSPLTRSKT